MGHEWIRVLRVGPTPRGTARGIVILGVSQEVTQALVVVLAGPNDLRPRPCRTTAAVSAMTNYQRPAVQRQYALLADPDYLRDQYVVRGLTHSQMAANIGCTRSAVSHALTRHGVRQPRRSRCPELDDPVWLADHLQDGVRHMASTLGCAQSTVYSALHRHGLPTPAAARLTRLDDDDWLYQQLVVDGRTAASVAADLGCHPQTVLRARDGHHIPPTPVRPPRLDDRDWLVGERVGHRRTLKDIADELGCHPQTVAAAIHRLGIRTAGIHRDRPPSPCTPTRLGSADV